MITAIPFGICTLILFFQYKRQQNLFVVFFGLTWMSLMFWTIIQALAYVFDSSMLFRLHIFALIPSGFFEILALDSISRENIDPLKVMILTAISAIIIIQLLDPNAILSILTFENQLSFTPVDNLYTMIGILALFIGITYFYYMLRIYIHAPAKLKMSARVNLLGAIFIGFGTPIVAILGLDKILFPGLDALMAGIGGIISAYMFSRNPQLAFILPFKAIQLRVMNIKTGIYMYMHNWESLSDDLNDGIFSDLLHAISAILNESLHQGNVKEIHLDNGILILHQCENPSIVVVLIASKSSKILRVALENFGKMFLAKYPNCATNYEKVSQFNEADLIVKECFPFIAQ